MFLQLRLLSNQHSAYPHIRSPTLRRIVANTCLTITAELLFTHIRHVVQVSARHWRKKNTARMKALISRFRPRDLRPFDVHAQTVNIAICIPDLLVAIP